MMSEYISNILIVDDKRANCISLRALLESDKTNILEACSGNDALKILLKEEIDMVLLDVQMPEMSGFEVAEIMRTNKRTQQIPIIFITAINKDEEYIFKGYQLGAVDYIYKPITNEILKNKVNVFIRLNEQKKIIVEKTKKLEEKIRELEIAKQKLKRIAKLDELTGIYNRRAFNKEFEEEWFRCMREGKNLSLIMVDIDSFKNYNDTYGHLQGDDCLIKISKRIQESIERPYDLVARYGGEEFVLLLPQTDSEGAKHIAEKIRINVEKLNIEHSMSTVADHVTISLGTTSIIPNQEYDRINLLRLADESLYEAKQNGRNQVVAKEYYKL